MILPPSFFLMIRHPPISPPFPSPTLFRSADHARAGHGGGAPRRGHPDRARPRGGRAPRAAGQRDHQRRRRSEEHTSELQSRQYLVCRLLLEKKKCSLLLEQKNPSCLHLTS